MSDLCTVWFAVVGVIVGMNFLGVLHSVRMVWLRLGDVGGWCAEWAVPIVICCRWCEGWHEFSWCSTQCAHGLVKTWWCQWLVCWMSRAQCDLLSLVWGLEFSWCSTQCAHGLVKTWWCQWLVCWMSRAQCDLLSLVWGLEWVFLVFFTVCAWFC